MSCLCDVRHMAEISSMLSQKDVSVEGSISNILNGITDSIKLDGFLVLKQEEDGKNIVSISDCGEFKNSNVEIPNKLKDGKIEIKSRDDCTTSTIQNYLNIQNIDYEGPYTEKGSSIFLISTLPKPKY